MEYETFTIKIPKGYKDQIEKVVMMKIESIISQIVLAPTQAKKDEYNTKVLEAKSINKLSIKV